MCGMRAALLGAVTDTHQALALVLDRLSVHGGGASDPCWRCAQPLATRGAQRQFTGLSVAVGGLCCMKGSRSRAVRNHRQRPRGLCCTSPPRPSRGQGVDLRGGGQGAGLYLAAWPGPWRMCAHGRSQGARRMRPSRSMRPRSALQASANDSRNSEDYARPVRLAVGGSSGAAVCPAGSFPGQTGAPVSRADHATFTVGHCPQGAPRRHCGVKSGHCHQTSGSLGTQ